MKSWFFPFTRNDTRAFLKMKSVISRRAPLHSADIRTGGEKGLVSVVLPVYNCEKYLEESVRSVLSQSYSNLELIIVDDGSTDNSGRIADSFMSEDSRVSVIHQKNLTLPVALNNGFAAARGEFFTWTSADNRMLLNCLEVLVSSLSVDRDTDMVFGNMRLIDEEGNLLRGYGWYEIPPFSGNVILPDSAESLNVRANNTIGAAFLYRAGAAAVLGGYSEFKYMLEDYDYFMRMNSLLSIRHTKNKKPIYEYRMHSGSLTAHDAELGITASRPALMELDSIRRKFYAKPLYFYADGVDKEIIAALSKSARHIHSPEKAMELSSLSPSRVFYVNFDNSPPTWTPPADTPKFLVSSVSPEEAWGFDIVLCKNSSARTDGVFYPSTAATAASFMLLRAANDIMYRFEGKQCV